MNADVKRRPRGQTRDGVQETSATTNALASLSAGAADEVARILDGTYVVVVLLPHEKYRRRVFLSLASAQRHADRAELAGHRAKVVLARLEPVVEVRP